MSYMTPADARNRQCCGPNHVKPTNAQGCAGPDCMAWRWQEPASRTETAPTLGWCGLVSRPD